MNRIITLIFSLFFIVLNCYAQKTYKIKFNNGEEHYVEILDENPDHLPRGNFKINVIKFGLLETGAYGPFTADIAYQRLLNDNKSVIEGNLCFIPIDSRYFEIDPTGYRPFNYMGELTFKRYFLQKSVVKQKKINFYGNYAGNTIFRAKIPESFVRKYGLRGGMNVTHNPVFYEESLRPGFGDVDIHAQSSLCWFAGISRSRFVNFVYSSETFGKAKMYLLGEVYLDLLFSPVIGVYGVHSSYDPLTYSYQEHSKGKLGKEYSDLVSKKHFGVRVGGTFRNSWIRSNRAGNYFGYEFAYYPGLAKNNVNVSIAYGIVIFGKTKHGFEH